MVVCCTCKKELPESSFYKRNKGGEKIQSRCKNCFKEWQKIYIPNNRDKIREKNRKWCSKNKDRYNELMLRGNLKREYGITVEKYREMVEDQRGKCLICGQTNGAMRLCVDHDHKTNKIRGLLCGKCNNGLGCFNDNIENMKKAIQYIVRNREEM